MRLGFRKEARASQESGSIFQIPEGITKSRGTRERAWTVGIVSWGRGRAWAVLYLLLFSEKKSSQQKGARDQRGVRVEGPATAEPVNRQTVHHTVPED